MKTLTAQLSRCLKIIFLFVILFTQLPPFVSGQIPESGLVVTPDSIASQIACEILNKGGNAVDASVAAMFALTVVQPYASGIGGGGFMLIRMNSDGKPIIIDFREQTPATIDPSIYYQDEETFSIYTKYGYRSICVPGMVAGAAKALNLYGTMSLKDILPPIIDLAKNGFEISESFSNLIRTYYDVIESNNATSQIFLPDWVPLKSGQIMTRTDLAHTFDLLSRHGEKLFYKGEIANRIISELNKNNVPIQAADLAAYQPQIKPAVQGSFRDCQILSTPPPSSGGVALIELLKILERTKINQFSLNSGYYIHFFAEAMKQVFEDREKYFPGDLKFDAIEFEYMISDEHAAKISSQIDTNRIKPVASKKIQSPLESRNASHISAMDRYGNAVSVSQSLQYFFGSGVTVPEYGILLNNAMANFSHQPSDANSIKPNKRPPTGLAPTIVIRQGKPFLILGGSGAEPIISMLAQIIINVVDFNLTLEEAIRSPRFHYNSDEGTIELETRIEANAIEYLKQLGHKVNLRTDYDIYFGSAQAIWYDPLQHRHSQVSDVRREGTIYRYTQVN